MTKRYQVIETPKDPCAAKHKRVAIAWLLAVMMFIGAPVGGGITWLLNRQSIGNAKIDDMKDRVAKVQEDVAYLRGRADCPQKDQACAKCDPNTVWDQYVQAKNRADTSSK